MAEFEPCGRGICAAEDGHAGTCDEASGWTETEFLPFECAHCKERVRAGGACGCTSIHMRPEEGR